MKDIKYKYGLPNALYGMTPAEGSKYLKKRIPGNDVISQNTLKEFMNRLIGMVELKREKMQLKEQSKGINQLDGFGGSQYLPSTLSQSIQQGIDFRNTATDQSSWWNKTFTGEDSWWGKNDGENKTNVLSGIGLAASALAPMIANRAAMKSLSKPETISPMLMDESVSPNFVNRQQLERNITRQAGSNRQALLDSSSGNFGQYAANLQGVNAGTSSAYANALLNADLADSQEKIRVEQLRNSLKQFNINQRMTAQEMNAQNKAAYNAQIAAFKQATGANIANIGTSVFNLMQAQGYGKEIEKLKTSRAIQGSTADVG
jgi:hypothetical protein